MTRTTTQSDTDQLTDLEDFARVLGTRTLWDGGERGGGGDDDAAVWRGENRKRAAKHGEARVELRKQLPGEREAGPGMLARLCLEF